MHQHAVEQEEELHILSLACDNVVVRELAIARAQPVAGDGPAHPYMVVRGMRRHYYATPQSSSSWSHRFSTAHDVVFLVHFFLIFRALPQMWSFLACCIIRCPLH
jgi:hypothetical protein